MFTFLKNVTLFASFFILTFNANAKDYTPAECPVVGNTDSFIYHVSGGYFYARMLRQNQGHDNRKCFKNEQQAVQAGYRRSRR